MTTPLTPSAKLPCGHTLKEHMMMQEARLSAGMEGATTDKTICQLIDLASEADTCPRCEGTGQFKRFGFTTKPCAICDGSGKLVASAPQTPEEVEKTLADIERRYRITSYSPWKDDVDKLLVIARYLEHNLKQAEKDAGRMQEALGRIEIDDITISEKELLATRALSSLSRPYPPTA